MVPSNGKPGVFRFSTDDLPERDRLPIWREVFGRAVIKADIEPLGDSPFLSESCVHLPDVTIRSSSASAAVVRRTAALVADGDDNFVLAIISRGQLMAAQGNREVLLDRGGAFLWSNAATGISRNPTTRDLVTLTLTRRSLSAAVKDLEHAVMRLIPPSAEALRLLSGYVDILLSGQAPIAPDLLALSASHIHDLAALALGATRDAAAIARNGGLRAARLQAVKADILANLARPNLTVGAVAIRQGISPRYIRALFDSEQMTFTDFVRERRLRLAYRMLSSVELAGRNISAIAFDCGFGDLSHFNATFRSRFGATPGDIRAKALNEAGLTI